MAKIIMIIDDDKNNLELQKQYLETEYDVVLAASGQSGLRRLRRVTPDLILLDYSMPDMSGLELLSHLQKEERLRRIPVIFLTGKHDAALEKECFVKGAADYITKPFVSSVLSERIRKTLEYWELRDHLENQVYAKTKQVEDVILQSIIAIANTIDAKDAYTKGHSERVAEYSSVIAKELGWPEEQVQKLYNIALLHDIGKIGVPDSILNKPGRLSDYEFSVIKKHAVMGGDILKNIHSMQDASLAARYHHERYDGRGYPNGLKGEQIPLFARVIAVADAYDAMTSNRVYRKKLSNSVVINEIKKGMGTQFDPEIASVFVDILTSSQDTALDEIEDKNEQMPKVLDKQKELDAYEKTHDVVSGLYRRAYGEQLIKQLPAREEYAFCLIDIGDFRRLNKEYGRVQGDYVLEAVAQIVKQHLRENEIAYRVYSGVFGAVLRSRSEADEIEAFAAGVIGEFKKKQQQTVVMKACRLYIGISMTATGGKDFDRLYRNADCALYYAKNNGQTNYAFYREREVVPVQADEGISRLVKCLFSQENRERYGVLENQKLNQLLDYIKEIIAESSSPCSMILFELMPAREKVEDYSCMSDSLNNLELAVTENLKKTDHGMRFCSSQYLVLFPEDADHKLEERIRKIVEQYYRMDSSTRFELQFRYETGVSAPDC